ncbi:MAG: hypothetical protein US31_C0002G0095 [Berkelbacteria bacterium GW2011_GWA1_36_9]|uniref:Phosphoesterase n=1 Tax=Berkelbacteria bacterium GW2011_GWA1_36_9 TaxID=1618331 RepID=A0A0G0FY80_9BACT|nr:MAG: hypothetical protein US31_C0002G0095 [Berkelbacteria bacterium GW2011_GWA1_36_9]
MKIALISDIHGNYSAFRAVWAEIKDYSLIMNVGDITGYYPDINESLKLLKNKKVINIFGNHDHYLLDGKLPFGKAEFLKKPFLNNLSTITQDNLAFLQLLESSLILSINNLTIGLFHGSLDNFEEYTYADNNFEAFKNSGLDVVVLGHTHQPMLKKINQTLVVNPGSVGQPRGLEKKSCYAIFDTQAKKVEFKKVYYNQTEICQKIELLGYDRQVIDILKEK